MDKVKQTNLSKQYWYLMRRYIRLLDAHQYDDLPFFNDDWARFVKRYFGICKESLSKFSCYIYERKDIANYLLRKMQYGKNVYNSNLLANTLETCISVWPMVF